MQRHAMAEAYPDSAALRPTHRQSGSEGIFDTPNEAHADTLSVTDELAANSMFVDRLRRLNQVSLQLAQLVDMDQLCHAAVELGLRELNFDRVGILLTGQDTEFVCGSYGTDEHGHLRDERNLSYRIADNALLANYIQYYDQREPCLLDHRSGEYGKRLGSYDWSAVAALWDDEHVIGYLFIDNMLHRQRYTTEDDQIISRYVATLGHLMAHLRIGHKLGERRAAANLFLSQMSALSTVIATLTTCDSFDDLCYKAVAMGRQQLGFDRLGLWFTTDEPDQIVGSYGTALTGEIRDERHQRFNFRNDHRMGRQLQSRERYVYEPSILLSDAYDSEIAHHGWKAVAALWSGEQIIGYLFTDNLILHRPYSENEGELLSLYALLLGHLCTRLRVEEVLRERENSYRTLIDAIPDYMFVVTREGIVLDYHEAQPATLNVPLVDMVGKHVRELVYAKAANLYMDAIERAFTTGDIVTFEYPLRYEESSYHLEVRVTAGGDKKAIILVRDITAGKLLEEQLVAAQKMESLGRMASGIAHDFNNLLTVIQGFASVSTALATDGPPRLLNALDRIRSASEKGARLTNQLLLFAKKQVVQPQVFQVQEQIRALITILESLLGEKIALSFTSDDNIDNIYMDPGQFEQVLINLAVNARDAMPNGGLYTIAICNVVITEAEQNQWLPIPTGRYVLVEASDTGTGMSEEVKKQIFEPFFTTKEPGHGTGLGLAICHGIVQQSGGQILVNSTVGKGTVFSIYLPITNRETGDHEEGEREEQRSGSETILLVEDDEPVRAVAAEMLTNCGYNVLECAGGRDALAKALSYPKSIDLLMTDMIMPKVSGREVAEKFMELRPGKPVLLVSGYAGELPDALVNLPNVRFLSKPFTFHTLTTAVRTILDD